MNENIEKIGGEVENDQENKEVKEKFRKLDQLFKFYFQAKMGRMMAKNGEESFSGDGATLYTLVSMPTPEGDKIYLAHIGWGEFSKETFTNEKYPEFNNSPIDLYCVRQSNSYHANESQKGKRVNNPEEYLKENTLILAGSNGEIETINEIERDEGKEFKAEIKPLPYKEMLAKLRNAVIDKYYSNREEFATQLQNLTEDHKELAELFRLFQSQNEEISAGQEEQLKLLGILINLGVIRLGILVGDEKAQDSVIQLKQEFDFNKNEFKAVE